MKRAIVLSGVSGTGKTYARLNDPELKDLPYVDIADFYKENADVHWAVAHALLKRKVAELLLEHDTVVVEGYFLPGTPSRNGLARALKVAGARADFRFYWAPFETCLERIRDQWEQGKITAADCEVRVEMLTSCWRPQ